jgi:hypothetical protein
MGKQSTIRKIRKRIKDEGGVSKSHIQEISIKGYHLVLRSDKRMVKVGRTLD